MRKVGVILVVAMSLLAAAPAGAATDTVKPRVRFATPDGATLVGAPVHGVVPEEMAAVAGRASDVRGSGLRRVVVTYCANAARSNGGYTCGTGGAALSEVITVRRAQLRCGATNRRRCSWAAPVPTTPGHYLVFATALDRAGNKRSAGPVFITVV